MLLIITNCLLNISVCLKTISSADEHLVEGQLLHDKPRLRKVNLKISNMSANANSLK
jgi:hypothetical protein